MVILRNIFNNDLYKHIQDDEYQNIRTGVKGIVDPEKANKIFKINVETTAIISEYPMVEQLIKTLDLKIEK